ncbi:MAG: hypothetical protein ACPLRM_06365, partial [Anaerolineae bacterium]
AMEVNWVTVDPESPEKSIVPDGEDLDYRALDALKDPEKKPEDLRAEVGRLLRLIHERLSPLWNLNERTPEQTLLNRVRLYILLALSDLEEPDRHRKRWMVIVDDTTDPACEDSLLLPSVVANSADEACKAAEHWYHVVHNMPGARVMAAWDAEWMAGLAATVLADPPSFAAATGPNGKVVSQRLQTDE